MNKTLHKYLLVSLGSLFFFLGTAGAKAATLMLVASQPAVDINQPFRVDLTLDTQEDTANAIQGEIDFPAAQFSLQSIDDGASPVSFWIDAPAQTSPGSVSFSGIMPGGFHGAASSVLSLWLLPTASGLGNIAISKLDLLQNDGQGTAIPVATSSVVISVGTSVATSSPNRAASLISPESFIPVVSSDTNIFSGKYFLAFSTTDKGTGIDHYEVLEVKTGGTENNSPSWRVATSPYLLEDQSLSSDIYIRAVDHTGNFIVVKVPAEHPTTMLSVRNWNALYALAVLFLLLLFALIALWRRRRA